MRLLDRSFDSRPMAMDLQSNLHWFSTCDKLKFNNICKIYICIGSLKNVTTEGKIHDEKISITSNKLLCEPVLRSEVNLSWPTDTAVFQGLLYYSTLSIDSTAIAQR